MVFPPFQRYPKLHSERVTLREMIEADAPFLLEIMTYDGREAKTIEDAGAMIRRIDDDYRNGSGVSWAIIDRASGQPLGTIGYYRGFENARGEVGFILLPAFEGKGYMSAALKLVVQFGSEVLQLDSIIAVTKPSNERAKNVLKRNGFEDRGAFDEQYVWFAIDDHNATVSG